jgi:Na+-driven multidrug efflux pump
MANIVAGKISIISLSAFHIIRQIWIFMAFFFDGMAMNCHIYVPFLKQKGEVGKLKKFTYQMLTLSFLTGLFASLFLFFSSFAITIFTSEQAIISQIYSVWYLVCFSLPISALAFAYDGIIMGFGRFDFLRKLIIFGAFFIFYPILYFAFSAQSFQLIILSMVIFNFERVIGAYIFLRKEIT